MKKSTPEVRLSPELQHEVDDIVEVFREDNGTARRNLIEMHESLSEMTTITLSKRTALKLFVQLDPVIKMTSSQVLDLCAYLDTLVKHDSAGNKFLDVSTRLPWPTADYGDDDQVSIGPVALPLRRLPIDIRRITHVNNVKIVGDEATRG